MLGTELRKGEAWPRRTGQEPSSSAGGRYLTGHCRKVSLAAPEGTKNGKSQVRRGSEGSLTEDV